MSKLIGHEGNDPDNVGRVSAARGYPDSFFDERRKALAMIQIRLYSRKPYANDEIRDWRRVLHEIDWIAGHEPDTD